MSPATHGKSYGFLETLKILRKKRGYWTAELAARKGSPSRLPALGEKLRWEPTENIGIPYVSCLSRAFANFRDTPAKKNRNKPFIGDIWET